MRALVLEISFFEAFFKVHYTKGFRSSYPIPLPTSVAGIFGALLGVEREKLQQYFENMLFGAKAKSSINAVSEVATFLQYKSQGSKIEKGATNLVLINEPTYLIAIGGEEEKIDEIKKEIQTSIKFIPYGGQNDFFVKNWKIVEVDEVEESSEISNYAPQDIVKTPKLVNGSEVQILPVMYKLSQNPNFYFVINGVLELNTKRPATKKEKIGLYKMSDFNFEVRK